MPAHHAKAVEELPLDSDEEMEEIFPDANGAQLPEPSAVDDNIVASSSAILSTKAPIEITLQRAKQPVDIDKEAAKKREQANAERLLRIESHKLHTVCLLANVSIRNRWINDSLLHARMMSLTPLWLQNSFQMISKKTQPDKNRRGRQFEAAVRQLTAWWLENFDLDTVPGVRSRPFEDVQAELLSKGFILTPSAFSLSFSAQAKGKGKAKAQTAFYDEDELAEGEIIKSSKSLMKHALRMSGSADTSAQLYTALCRAIGVPARLVVSLQGVPWRKRSETTPKKKGKTGTKSMPSTEVDSDDDMEEVFPEPVKVDRKGKGKAVDNFPGEGQTLSGKLAKAKSTSPIKLRQSRPQGRTLRDTVSIDSPPIFWTEVFSRPDGRWIPVDPIRGTVDKKRSFEPASNDRTNRMVYVVAFEEDGFARDVTPRYAKNFGTKTAKIRIGGGKSGKKDWWEEVMRPLSRPYRLNRDDTEDAEFQTLQISEGMPSSVAAFKNHLLYILERHIKRDEVIYPKSQLGKFRGEPVYSKSYLVALKTSESWMRLGRVVKSGEQPLKMVKARAVTINKRRELEALKELEKDKGLEQDQDAGVLQGMYAEWQTELYIPMAIVGGRVPKNDFGNIDLYTPTMLPPGGVHIPYKGVAKIAKQLGIDYAEAVTGFEFKKRRALPILTGIVVAEENEEVIVEAYWESAAAAEETQRVKKQERILKNWARLVQGLRIRARIQRDYGGPGIDGTAAKGKPVEIELEAPPLAEGGFLPEYEGVIKPFQLPKMQHLVIEDSPRVPSSSNAAEQEPDAERPIVTYYVFTDSDSDQSLEEVQASSSNLVQHARTPKTMQEIAETQHQIHDTPISLSSDFEDDAKPAPISSKRAAQSTAAANKKPIPRQHTRPEAGASTSTEASTSKRVTRSSTGAKPTPKYTLPDTDEESESDNYLSRSSLSGTLKIVIPAAVTTGDSGAQRSSALATEGDVSTSDDTASSLLPEPNSRPRACPKPSPLRKSSTAPDTPLAENGKLRTTRSSNRVSTNSTQTLKRPRTDSDLLSDSGTPSPASTATRRSRRTSKR